MANNPGPKSGSEGSPNSERGKSTNNYKWLDKAGREVSYGLPDDPDLSGYFEELKTQSERGVAVLAAAWLEWRVRQGIKCCMPCWDKNAESIFGNDKSPGELSYKYQCRMAYTLGLIGPISLADFDRIGRIRNKFAHRPSVRSFDHEAVSALCDELQTPAEVDKFYTSCDFQPPPIERNRREVYEYTVYMQSLMIFAAMLVGIDERRIVSDKLSLFF